MKHVSTKRLRTTDPIWCDECRLRIAPYEEAATAGGRAFHKRCYDKAEMKASRPAAIKNTVEGTGTADAVTVAVYAAV